MALVVHYFPFRARAESTKLMLAYANVPYELHSVTNAEWGGGGKTSDQLTVFGQLPSITTPSGKLISQTGALVRYTARLCQLVPTDDDLVT